MTNTANLLTTELLRRSVQEWNQVRHDNPNVVPDLSGADMTRADMTRADMTRANR